VKDVDLLCDFVKRGVRVDVSADFRKRMNEKMGVF
jgi:hypothetical protein